MARLKAFKNDIFGTPIYIHSPGINAMLSRALYSSRKPLSKNAFFDTSPVAKSLVVELDFSIYVRTI